MTDYNVTSPANTQSVKMETQFQSGGDHSNLSSSLSGFFLLITVVTVLFDILAAIFLVYNPP